MSDVSTNEALRAGISSNWYGVKAHVYKGNTIVATCQHFHRTVGPAEDCSKRLLTAVLKAAK